MSNQCQQEILKSIDINKNHIDNQQLSTDTGTKRMQASFYKNAVNERNKYVRKQQDIFNFYKENVFELLKSKILEMMPHNNHDHFENEKNKLSIALEMVQYNNNEMSDSFKLGIVYLVSSINDEILLEELNIIIKKFIDVFKNIGISLNLNDFSYTMFTEKYMQSYLNNIDLEQDDFSIKMKESFDEIYWECPDIIMQLKMCLESITSKYKKELSIYTSNSAEELLKEKNIENTEVIEHYVSERSKLEESIAKDEYLNLNLFLNNSKNIDDYLENSRIRIDTFNQFDSNNDYSIMDDDDKEEFNNSIMELANTLHVLKKYYTYEFIIKDLIQRYKNKTNNKELYEQKLKEISNEEKTRIKIYNDYQKANKKGFFKQINKKKLKLLKLRMNEQIKVLNQLYLELNTLEIDVIVEKNANEATTIYELLLLSLNSFYYLENQINNMIDIQDDKNIQVIIEDYIKFIYNPHNLFLRRINAFVDYEIEDVIADKYHLLGLNITKEEINKDVIDNILERLDYIVLIQNINNSKISLEKIKLIKDSMEIINTYEDIEKI